MIESALKESTEGPMDFMNMNVVKNADVEAPRVSANDSRRTIVALLSAAAISIAVWALVIGFNIR
jgi:hypothetical protein